MSSQKPDIEVRRVVTLDELRKFMSDRDIAAAMLGKTEIIPGFTTSVTVLCAKRTCPLHGMGDDGDICAEDDCNETACASTGMCDAHVRAKRARPAKPARPPGCSVSSCPAHGAIGERSTVSDVCSEGDCAEDACVTTGMCREHTDARAAKPSANPQVAQDAKKEGPTVPLPGPRITPSLAVRAKHVLANSPQKVEANMKVWTANPKCIVEGRGTPSTDQERAIHRQLDAQKEYMAADKDWNTALTSRDAMLKFFGRYDISKWAQYGTSREKVYHHVYTTLEKRDTGMSPLSMIAIICAASIGYIDPKWGTKPGNSNTFFELLRGEDLFATP